MARPISEHRGISVRLAAGTNIIGSSTVVYHMDNSARRPEKSEAEAFSQWPLKHLCVCYLPCFLPCNTNFYNTALNHFNVERIYFLFIVQTGLDRKLCRQN